MIVQITITRNELFLLKEMLPIWKKYSDGFVFYVDNSTDGTYDILILNKKVEIKTARIGINGSFQHDGLRNTGSDYYLFLDIKPDCIYLTILLHFDLSNKCEIIERTPHLRKGTLNVYKFDFGEKNILKSIKKGFSILINNETLAAQIKRFICDRMETMTTTTVGTPI